MLLTPLLIVTTRFFPRTGQVAKFIVNTVNAGSGSLAVTVEGPSKVKLECKEVSTSRQTEIHRIRERN